MDMGYDSRFPTYYERAKQYLEKPFFEKREIELDSSILDDYVGHYELASGQILILSRKEGHLFAQIVGMPGSEILPESEDVFFIEAVDATIIFIRNKEGKVVELILRDSKRETHARRIK
jgi:hypothetical protein